MNIEQGNGVLVSPVINHKTIRAENRKKILQLLIRKRELTIPEISRDIRVSIPTVSKNITQLIAEGIVKEAGVSESTGGRKPMMIEFLPDSYYAVGVEFSTEGYVRIILTNLDSTIRANRVLRNPDFHEMDKLMLTIQEEIASILLEKEIARQRVLGVGMSLPGTVNEETRLLKIAPNLGLKQVDFAKYAAQMPFPLFIENDANAAAIAEMTIGVAKTMRNLVYLLVLLHGIGAGIVIGGQLYRGSNKRAGEISHVAIAAQGRLCSCGWRDCWELYASATALLTMYQDKTGKAVSDLKEFFTILKRYEPAAVEVFDAYANYLALGMRNLLLLQDPHDLVLGGVLSQFDDVVLEPLREKIFRDNPFYDRTDVHIMSSTLKEDACILGASLLPFDKIFFLHETAG